MTNKLRTTLCSLLAASALSGCTPAPEADAPSSPAVHARIVVMAPAAAEMLAALDALDRVVGVGDFVSEPASLAGLPRVGAYDAPSVERVVELRADLFLTAASDAASAAHRRLESLGVDVVALDTSTHEGVFASLSALGALLGREERARTLGREMRDRLEAIRAVAADLPPRRVLVVVGRDPLYVAGPGSHLDEMIALVGGSNVAHDAPSPYHRVSLEAVLERMPEVIVDASDNRPTAPRGRLEGDWGRWTFLPAVRRQRVYWVDPSRLVIPGIRLPEMTRLMGKLIQPEAFGEVADDELVGP
jgi:ABC-type Fe3+-hydroxamate transport system substrate-binding protein